MSKMDEIVYAVKRKDIENKTPLFQEYITPPDENILSFIYNNSFPIRRGDCENNPELKHIIPYVFLTSENLIFVVKRTESQTEKRLHNKLSIGIGGHVGPNNFNYQYPLIGSTTKDAIYTGMLRELNEELNNVSKYFISIDTIPRLVGMVNDDSNSVGSVHFGLVYNLEIPETKIHEVSVKETENMVGEWMNIYDAQKLEGYETWSQFIIDEL